MYIAMLIDKEGIEVKDPAYSPQRLDIDHNKSLKGALLFAPITFNFANAHDGFSRVIIAYRDNNTLNILWKYELRDITIGDKGGMLRLVDIGIIPTPDKLLNAGKVIVG